jgi:hypothetical protein
MNIIKLDIVGIPHRKELKGHVSEFLAEAPGKSMTLRPESANDNDKVAVRAYDWTGRHVGYVSSADLPRAWGALRCCEHTKLRGMIVSSDIEHPCIGFECVVKGYKGPATDLYPQKMFLDWKYTGPVLDIPEEFDNLLYMRDEIIDRLAEREEWDDDDERYFIELAKRFAANLKYDISGEMSDYRCRLIEMLTELGDGRLQEVIDELKMSGGRTGRETTYGRVLEFWKEQMQSAETRKHLMVHCRHYDVKQVEKELELFPEELYFVWKANPERFVSKLYYRHIPREVIWRFVSGIAFVEMMNACAKKAEKPSGDTTIINIATNKKDNHFEKDSHCQVFNDRVEGRFGNLE